MGNIHKNCGMKTSAFLCCITSLFISFKKQLDFPEKENKNKKFNEMQ